MFFFVFFFVFFQNAVAGRCIPTLPDISTIEDVIFNKTPIPVTVQGLVNGTTILAELLNARQVLLLFPTVISSIVADIYIEFR